MKTAIGEDEQLGGNMEAENKQKIESKLKEVSEWLDDAQEADKDEFDDKYHELEAVCNPIIKRRFMKAVVQALRRKKSMTMMNCKIFLIVCRYTLFRVFMSYIYIYMHSSSSSLIIFI